MLYYFFNYSGIWNDKDIELFYNVSLNLAVGRVERLIKHLSVYQPKLSLCKIVDHACHKGHYISEIQRRLPSASCLGTDISDMQLNLNRQNNRYENLIFKTLDLKKYFNYSILHESDVFQDHHIVIISDILYYMSESKIPCFFYWSQFFTFFITKKRAVCILKNWILQAKHIIVFSNHQYHKTIFPVLQKTIQETHNECTWVIDDFWLICIKK